MIKHTQRKQSILGQNFILDSEIMQSILTHCNITSSDVVLEIGAGLGTLTEPLAKQAGKVISLEIDSSLMPYLIPIQDKFNNLEIINTDFMCWNMQDYFKNIDSIKVVANIPYYITSDIYHKLLFSPILIQEIDCMVQLEVAKKIVATKSDKNSYGVLSLICQHRYNASIEQIVPKEKFTPIPKVDSAFVRLCLKDNSTHNNEFDNNYYKFVKSAFLHRRKTLINSLKASAYNVSIIADTLNALNIKPNVRAEELSYDDYINIITLAKI